MTHCRATRICHLPSVICHAVIASLLLGACGRPFQVPERIRPLTGNLAGRTTDNDLTVEAAAIVNEDDLWQLFEANMILARILVVKLTLANNGRHPVEIKDVVFRIRDSQGREFEPLKPKDVEDQLYDYYEIRTYVIATRQELEEAFQRRALDTQKQLTPGEVRQGLVYFKIPEAVDRFGRFETLTLHIEKVRFSEAEKTLKLLLRH